MKQTILALTLITATLLGSSLSEKAPMVETTSNPPKNHNFCFSFSGQNSLHEDAPALLSLGLGYKQKRENASAFGTTALSVELGFTIPEYEAYKALLEKNSELLALGRIMAVHYFNPSEKWKYFVSLGGHFSLSDFEKSSSHIEILDETTLEMNFHSVLDIHTTYSYLGPSMIIGLEFLTPKAQTNTFSLELGYDHPMICIKGKNRSHEFGRIFIGYTIGY
jgi:hypothetical protein